MSGVPPPAGVSARGRALFFLGLLALAMVVALAWPDAAQPARHFLRNLLRHLF